MDLLFLILLVLSPLPGCFVLYRYLNRRTPELIGRFFKGFKIKVSGILIVYVIILFLEIVFLAPDIIHLDVDNSRQAWRYHIAISADAVTQQADRQLLEFKGVLQLRKYSGNIIYVSGLSDGILSAIPVVGLRDEHLLYFPISREVTQSGQHQIPPLIAFGVMHNNNVNLSIYTLVTTNASGLQDWHGSVSLERVWPIAPLLITAILPIFVIVLLERLGLLLGKTQFFISHDGAKKSSGKSNHSGFELQFHGAIVAYVVVLLLVLIFANNGIPRFTCENRDVAKKYCDQFAGKKYFKAQVFPSNTEPNAAIRYGQITTDCGDELKSAVIQGVAAKTHDGHDAMHDVNWKTILLGLDKSQLFAIYDFGAVVNRTGLLVGSLIPQTGKYDFHYYDFKKPYASQASVSGYLLVSDEPINEVSRRRL